MSYNDSTSFNDYMRVISDCATLKLQADSYAFKCDKLSKALKECIELFEKSQKISLDSEFIAKQLQEFTSLLENSQEDGSPKI